MRELSRYTLFGGFSVKRMLLTFATIVAVCFLYTSLVSQTPAHAIDARWEGESLKYNENIYAKQEPVKNGDPRGMPEGTIPFTYIEAVGTAKKAHILYIKAGTDPPSSATSAEYMVYDYSPGPPEQYKPLTTVQTVTISPEGSERPTSCDSSATAGIGWIVCPISNFLARAMDWLYSQLSDFLEVRTLQSDETALYRVWAIMCSLANIVFVIVFLILIYSQITSLGISNYGIKKILPRLVVTALLVNLSYWICAALVDISNITGYALHDILNSVRESLIVPGEVERDTSWDTITQVVLSGGTVGAVGWLGYATVASAGANIFGLIPILVGVIFAALVALLILAARQAFIAILIIISPLAFVAYLLPNTEKYFDKWKDTFLTLLMLFPIFSIIFAGSQLAGSIIIQNASGPNQLMIVIFGMAVQVAPVVITPLLVKYSGSLLGRIAGLVNNPNKGIIDRSRRWSEDRREKFKDKQLGQGKNLLARGGRNIQQRRMRRDGLQKAHQTMAENAFNASKRGQEIDEINRRVERTKQTIQGEQEVAWQLKISTDKNEFEKELRQKTTASNAELQKAKMDKIYQEIQAGDRKYIRSFDFSDADDPALKSRMMSLAHRAQRTAEETAYTGMAKKMAEHHQQDNIADALINNRRFVDGKTVREYTGGILGDQGEKSALASAVAIKREQYGKSIGEMDELIKHFNPSSNSLQNLLVKGEAAIGTDSQGRTFEFTRDNIYAVEAAINKQVSVGNVDMVDQIVQLSGSDLAEYRTSIADALAKAGHTSRSIYQGGPLIDFIAQGKISNERDLTGYIQDLMIKGKFSPEQLATADEGALKRFLKAAQEPAVDPTKAADLAVAVNKLQAKANTALTDSIINGKIKDNAEPILKSIRDL